MRPPEPIKAHAEETVVGLGFAHERRIGWLIEGPNAKRDAERIMALEACPFCLEVYPAPLKPEYEHVWRHKLRLMRRSDGQRPWPSIPEERLLMMVRYQQCPTCKKPVSEQVAQIQYVGEDEWAPGGAKNKNRLGNLIDQPLPDQGLLVGEDPVEKDPDSARRLVDKLDRAKRKGRILDLLVGDDE